MPLQAYSTICLIPFVAKPLQLYRRKTGVESGKVGADYLSVCEFRFHPLRGVNQDQARQPFAGDESLKGMSIVGDDNHMPLKVDRWLSPTHTFKAIGEI